MTQTVVTPGLALQDIIFEQTDTGAYIVYHRHEQKFLVADNPWNTFTHNDTRYVPLKRVPWPTAHIPKDYESEEALFNRVKKFFIEHLDVANELMYDVYAAFVLASWIPENFTVVPYLFFLGPMASGKTRALECFHRLCYRSIMATSMSAASLFRALEAWHPTIMLDETEIYNRKEMVEVLAILNSGYRRGQYAIRIEKVQNNIPQIAVFDTFGFKVLAGTQELADTLQSRCIITKMSKAVRPVRLFIDEEEAQEIRNQLLMYRFKNLNSNTPQINCLENGGDCQGNARVLELFISLFQVAPSQAIKDNLEQAMKQIVQTRLNEEQTSIEARVLDAILKCEDKVENGKLAIQKVTEAYNEGLPEKEHVTSQLVGRIVTRLGFEKCRTGQKGLAGFFWDTQIIERLKMRYYPQQTLSKLPSVSSVPPANHKTNLHKTEETERSEEKPGTLPPLNEPWLHLDQIKAIYWSDGFFDWHPCAICGYTKLTAWKAQTFKGENAWICEDCKELWEKQHDGDF
ncbi:MAG: hypothetical protein QXL77_08330 [Candidatus Bathyarchaeia archaeon]